MRLQYAPNPGMGLSCHEVDTTDALAALGPEWRALEDASLNRLPFLTFDWVESWWRHFAEQRQAVADHLEVRLLRDSAGAIRGAFPFMRTERPGRGPLRVRVLQFFGSDPNITELRGALIHPGYEAAVTEALLADLDSRAGDQDWVQWSGIPAGSELEAALVRRPAVAWTRDIPNYILPLAQTWEEQQSLLKRNIRESLRKCYNSLKRDGHSFTLEVVREPESVRGALEHFFRLHARRADQTGTVVHRNVFEAPASRAFLLDVSERLARRGATRIFLLRVREEVVALRIAYVLQDSIYLYYSGYDPAWGKYSIMTTVVAEALKYAIEQGLKSANLSTGNDVSKTRWGPQEYIYRDAVQQRLSPRSRLARHGYELVQRARSDPRLKQLLARYLARRREA
jgi:CelD/BcsL family acetyltransferase involved in cellulose biosynthesis